MRVLHLDTERTWRGGEAQLLHLATGLARRGHVCVVVGQPDAPLLARAAAAGLAVEAIPMVSEWSPVAVARLARRLRAHAIEVLHMHTSHAAGIGAWAALVAGTPVRVISRRVDFRITANPLRRLKYDWAADRVLAISEGVRRVLIEGGVRPDRIEVVHSGIDPERFDPALAGALVRHEFGIPADAPVIGCIAHFADHKDHGTLIAAAARAVAARPETRVLLVGDGELRPKIEHQVNHLRLRDNIILAGFRTDIPQLLAAMDIVTLASHHEGLGTSLLDAMAMARPVVATAVGGIPEIVVDGETGRLVPPRDPAALADALLALIADPTACARLGAAGRRRMLERFSAAAMVERTEAVYRTLLAARAPAAPMGCAG